MSVVMVETESCRQLAILHVQRREWRLALLRRPEHAWRLEAEVRPHARVTASLAWSWIGARKAGDPFVVLIAREFNTRDVSVYRAA